MRFFQGLHVIPGIACDSNFSTYKGLRPFLISPAVIETLFIFQ